MADNAKVLKDFPWHKPPAKESPPKLTWHIGRTTYKIYCHTISSFQSSDLVPHCVEVMGLVRREVYNSNHLGESLFRALLMTLDTPLGALWDRVVGDMGPELVMSVDNFKVAVKRFIAINGTPQERHSLVRQLLHPTKPRDLDVYSFYYRLIELNGYVDYLPGIDPELSEDQLKQAFYDGMPAPWRERFIVAGLKFWDMSLAETLRYFRNQESLAEQRAQDNQASKRIKNKRRSTNEQQSAESAKSSKSNKFKTHKEKGNKKQKGRVADDDPCPVHPGSKHTWGQCNANRFNSTSDTLKGSKNKPKNKNQGKSKEQSKTNDSSDPSDGFSNDVIPDDFYSKERTVPGSRAMHMTTLTSSTTFVPPCTLWQRTQNLIPSLCKSVPKRSFLPSMIKLALKK